MMTRIMLFIAFLAILIVPTLFFYWAGETERANWIVYQETSLGEAAIQLVVPKSAGDMPTASISKMTSAINDPNAIQYAVEFPADLEDADVLFFYMNAHSGGSSHLPIIFHSAGASTTLITELHTEVDNKTETTRVVASLTASGIVTVIPKGLFQIEYHPVDASFPKNAVVEHTVTITPNEDPTVIDGLNITLSGQHWTIGIDAKTDAILASRGAGDLEPDSYFFATSTLGIGERYDVAYPFTCTKPGEIDVYTDPPATMRYSVSVAPNVERVITNTLSLRAFNMCRLSTDDEEDHESGEVRI